MRGRRRGVLSKSASHNESGYYVNYRARVQLEHESERRKMMQNTRALALFQQQHDKKVQAVILLQAAVRRFLVRTNIDNVHYMRWLKDKWSVQKLFQLYCEMAPVVDITLSNPEKLPSLATEETVAAETKKSPLEVHVRFVGRAQEELLNLAEHVKHCEQHGLPEVSKEISGQGAHMMTLGGFALFIRDCFCMPSMSVSHGQMLAVFTKACGKQHVPQGLLRARYMELYYAKAASAIGGEVDKQGSIPAGNNWNLIMDLHGFQIALRELSMRWWNARTPPAVKMLAETLAKAKAKGGASDGGEAKPPSAPRSRWQRLRPARVKLIAQEHQFLNHFRVYWLAHRRHADFGGHVNRSFKASHTIDMADMSDDDEPRKAAEAKAALEALNNSEQVPTQPKSYGVRRVGKGQGASRIAMRGKFIRDPETGRLVLESYSSGQVKRKMVGIESKEEKKKKAAPATPMKHRTAKQAAEALQGTEFQVGADKDAVMKLGDPRVLAVLVRYESEFEALFAKYHTRQSSGQKHMKRIQQAAPACFSGRVLADGVRSMSYLDFLRSVCETGLLPSSLFAKPATMVSLMNIFLSCFPLIRALSHEPRGSSMSNLLNMSVLKDHLDASFSETAVEGKVLPRSVIQILRRHGYSITDTELRLALQRRKLSMASPVVLDEFIRLARDVLLVRYQVQTQYITRWQYSHCLVLCACHGLIDVSSAVARKRSRVRLQQGQRTILMMLRTMGPLATAMQIRKERVDEELPHFETCAKALVAQVYKRFTMMANPQYASSGGRDMNMSAFTTMMKISKLFPSVPAELWKQAYTFAKPATRITLSSQELFKALVWLLEREYEAAGGQKGRFSDAMTPAPATLLCGPLPVPFLLFVNQCARDARDAAAREARERARAAALARRDSSSSLTSLPSSGNGSWGDLRKAGENAAAADKDFGVALPAKKQAAKALAALAGGRRKVKGVGKLASLLKPASRPVAPGDGISPYGVGIRRMGYRLWLLFNVYKPRVLEAEELRVTQAFPAKLGQVAASGTSRLAKAMHADAAAAMKRRELALDLSAAGGSTSAERYWANKIVQQPWATRDVKLRLKRMLAGGDAESLPTPQVLKDQPPLPLPTPKPSSQGVAHMAATFLTQALDEGDEAKPETNAGSEGEEGEEEEDDVLGDLVDTKIRRSPRNQKSKAQVPPLDLSAALQEDETGGLGWAWGSARAKSRHGRDAAEAVEAATARLPTRPHTTGPTTRYQRPAATTRPATAGAAVPQHGAKFRPFSTRSGGNVSAALRGQAPLHTLRYASRATEYYTAMLRSMPANSALQKSFDQYRKDERGIRRWEAAVQFMPAPRTPKHILLDPGSWKQPPSAFTE